MPAAPLQQAAAALARARHLVTFSGAGLSKASGIPTYRDAGGLWLTSGNLKYSHVDSFRAEPEAFLDFWAQRQAELSRAEPNAGHLALAALETRLPAVTNRKTHTRITHITHITQNVDGLLTKAGCRTVHELHGSLLRYRCDACGLAAFAPQPRCPVCGAVARPDVVMFGEYLPERPLQLAAAAASACDVCLVVGTSAVVHPAAGLVLQAHAAGARIIVLNPEATELDGLAHVQLRGRAEEMLPALLQGL